jgi:hypothetical protein
MVATEALALPDPARRRLIADLRDGRGPSTLDRARQKRLAGCIGLLTTDIAGERQGALAGIDRILQAAGLTWDVLVGKPPPQPKPKPLPLTAEMRRKLDFCLAHVGELAPHCRDYLAVIAKGMEEYPSVWGKSLDTVYDDILKARAKAAAVPPSQWRWKLDFCRAHIGEAPHWRSHLDNVAKGLEHDPVSYLPLLDQIYEAILRALARSVPPQPEPKARAKARAKPKRPEAWEAQWKTCFKHCFDLTRDEAAFLRKVHRAGSVTHDDRAELARIFAKVTQPHTRAKPTGWQADVHYCLQHPASLTEWEADFLSSLSGWGKPLTDKQTTALATIVAKVARR